MLSMCSLPLVTSTTTCATLIPVQLRWRFTSSFPWSLGPWEYMNHLSSMLSGRKPAMSELISAGERGTFQATVLVWLGRKDSDFQSKGWTRVVEWLLFILRWRRRHRQTKGSIAYREM